jgi:hypothetical protein
MVTQVKTNDIEAIAVAFYKNLGNGAAAGENLAKIIHAVVQSRDTTIFARYVHRVTTEKKDANAARAMRRVFKAVFPDAKMATGKDGKPVFKIQGAMHNEDAIKRMDAAVKDKVSLRGKFADLVVGESTNEPKPFDPKATAERLVKAHKDHPEDIDALIAALQQARQTIAGNGEPNH